MSKWSKRKNQVLNVRKNHQRRLELRSLRKEYKNAHKVEKLPLTKRLDTLMNKFKFIIENVTEIMRNGVLGKESVLLQTLWVFAKILLGYKRNGTFECTVEEINYSPVKTPMNQDRGMNLEENNTIVHTQRTKTDFHLRVKTLI